MMQPTGKRCCRTPTPRFIGAKTEGRDTFRFFEAAMGAAVRDRRQLEHDLRQAVARDEFRLVYQPQGDISSSQMVGFEALLRWHHPTRGLVPPDTFIPIAEETRRHSADRRMGAARPRAVKLPPGRSR